MSLRFKKFALLLCAGLCVYGWACVVSCKAAELADSPKSEIRINLPSLKQPVPWSREWRKYYDNASKALVDIARESGLDYKALQKAMRDILDFPGFKRRPHVLLPDSATWTRVGGEPAWHIDLLWEYDEENPAGQYVIHICKFEFSRMQLRFAGACD